MRFGKSETVAPSAKQGILLIACLWVSVSVPLSAATWPGDVDGFRLFASPGEQRTEFRLNLSDSHGELPDRTSETGLQDGRNGSSPAMPSVSLGDADSLVPGFDGAALPGPRLASIVPRLRSDIFDLATSPLGMERNDWKRLGLGIAAVGAVSLLDNEIRDVVRSDESPGTERFAKSIRPLANEGGFAILGTLWIAGRTSNNPMLTSMARDGFEAVVVSAGVVTPLLKTVSGRSRPRQGYGSLSFKGGSESFPSGEVTEAFAIASVISAHSSNRWVDVLSWTGAGLIAWERMRLDAHWASDVTAGALIGAAVGRWVVKRNRLYEGSSRGWTVVPQVGAGRIGATFRVSFK